MFSLDLSNKSEFSTSFDYYVEDEHGVFRPVFINSDHLIVISTSGGLPGSLYIFRSQKDVLKNQHDNSTSKIISIQYHDNEFIESNFPEAFLFKYKLLTDSPLEAVPKVLGGEYSELIVAAETDKLIINYDLSAAVNSNNDSLVPMNLTDALFAYLNNTMLWLGVNEKLFLKVMRKTVVLTVSHMTPLGNSHVFGKVMMKALIANFFDNLLKWLNSNPEDRDEVKEELKKKK